MYRAKWIRIDVDGTHKTLIAGIRATQFSEEVGCGFDLLFRDDRSIRAKFIEKIATIEIVTDPFGVSSSIETTRYSSTEFQLTIFSSEGVRSYLMEVRFPPRTLRTLIAALDTVATGLVVSEVQLPLMDVFSILRKSSVTPRLTRIKASQLKLTPESVAKIDVISSGNAVTDLKRHFEVDAISIDKIRVERPFGAAAHSMELSRNGLISVDDSYQEVASEFLLDLLMNQYTAPPGSRQRL